MATIALQTIGPKAIKTGVPHSILQDDINTCESFAAGLVAGTFCSIDATDQLVAFDAAEQFAGVVLQNEQQIIGLDNYDAQYDRFAEYLSGGDVYMTAAAASTEPTKHGAVFANASGEATGDEVDSAVPATYIATIVPQTATTTGIWLVRVAK